MTISVRMTPVKALADDKFKSLFDLYAAESGIESFGNWAVAWQNYEAMENAGCLVVYVAYDDDTPRGHYRLPGNASPALLRPDVVNGLLFRSPGIPRQRCRRPLAGVSLPPG